MSTSHNTPETVGLWTGILGAVGAAAFAVWRFLQIFFTFKAEHEALLKSMAEEHSRVALINSLRAEVDAAREERHELITEVRALRADIRTDVANLAAQLHEALLALATKRAE